ncbi:hypothetical protein TrVE_jg1314 [Triparma verrucosa]|uniref:Uncharacterized protein n=1 Tax=Triparma verrucosa TaxID=1606542 RepID=A0A9W7BHL6_9STRA|nr:hypothetical protein TrVE_jg1314 [Triparma verrucosa]
MFKGLSALENIIHGVGSTVQHITHDVGENLHNIEGKVAHMAEDVGDTIENVIDDARDNFEDAAHKIGDTLHFGLGVQKTAAQNLVAGTANQLNETLGFGFAKVEKHKMETEGEKDAKLKALQDKIAKANAAKKLDDDKRRRRSTTNAASERRHMMFSEANESDSLKEAKADMFMGGKASIWKTTTEEMGEMGIGIQLYFQISKILSISFLLMTICHIPTMYLNSAGNDGHALSPDLVGVGVTLALANQGFSWDTVEEPDCESNGGNVDCTGRTVNIFGTRWDAEEVSTTIMICEFMAGVIFIITCGACILVVEKLEAQVDDENAEPEDYGVFVRGLPADVTLQDLIDHFSPMNALDKETPYYPSKLTPFGLSIRRATKYFWWWLLFVSPFVAWFVGAVTDDPEKGAIGGLWSGLIIVVDFAWTNYVQRGNKPLMRKSPVVLYDEEETARRKKERAKKEKKRAKAKAKKKVRVSATIYAEEEGKKEDDNEEKEYDPANDVFRPNPRPVSDVSNTGNKIYLNTWIAEISLVHPTGGVIGKFKDKESSLKRMKVREVKLQKRGEIEGAGPKQNRKLAAAKLRMEAKTKRLTQSVKPENAGDVSAAFVIFNCEESKNRCLEDYSETGSFFFRYFQAKKLNLVKNGVSYKLRVESAPTPDLIFWENLHLEDAERFARGSFTAILTTAILLISFALIYVTNLYAKAAAAALPETALCQSILPTIIQGNRSFGDNPSLVHNKTLSESVCGGVGEHIAFEGYDYDSLNPFYIDFKETPESAKVKTPVQRSEVRDLFEEVLASANMSSSDLAEVSEYRLCDSQCINTSATENDMCGSLGCQLLLYENVVKSSVNNRSDVIHDFECTTYSEIMLQACYCQEKMNEMVAAKGMGAWSEMKDMDGEGPLCADFADNYFNAQILAISGALFMS